MSANPSLYVKSQTACLPAVALRTDTGMQIPNLVVNKNIRIWFD